MIPNYSVGNTLNKAFVLVHYESYAVFTFVSMFVI